MMDVRFWGLRGGVPVCNPGSQRYGGNTACVEVRCGDQILILDAGSGLINLGGVLLEEFRDKPFQAHLFLTHTHWDHTMGIPFFAPLYQCAGKLTVYGIAGSEKSILSLFSVRDSAEFLPVPMGKPAAEVEFRPLEEKMQIGRAEVTYYYLNHPGLTIGYRVECDGVSLAYLTDNEPYRRSNLELVKEPEDMSYLARIDREIVQFARKADLIIADAAYNEEESGESYKEGHSSVGDALQVALSAQCRMLVLFHHPPLRTDDQIDRLAEKCRARLTALHSKMQVLTPAEGQWVHLKHAKPSDEIIS
jgi:phosphoribosyl 1,2-cyclic phosphodiesterase